MECCSQWRKNRYSCIIPNYVIEITKLAKVIAAWAFTDNHRLT